MSIANENTSPLINSDDASETSFARLPSIEDFVFLKPISRGAFGFVLMLLAHLEGSSRKVFLGHKNGKTEKLYAIKVMKKADMINKNLVHQVLAERDAMAKSTSPFVVHLYYSLQSQQNIFLIMEYLIGGDVKSLLTVCGYFDEEMAIQYTAEVTLALEYLHSKGIVHRDLKPDNMLITDGGHIKLTDFGLSKLNMDFTPHGMPQTPLPYSQVLADNFRTPGQILSLRSSLVFNSTKKCSVPSTSCVNTPSLKASKCRKPLKEVTAELFSASKNKPKSLRDQLLSQSATKKVTPLKMAPPVQSLTSSLKDSLNWSNSNSEQSSVLHKELPTPRSPAMTPSMYALSNASGSISIDSSAFSVSVENLSDNVFDVCDKSNRPVNGENVCSCHDNKCDKSECSECGSHLKAPSRQECITDDTPQMHRTEESVWNSYAAKNLRSMRHGSYSEDSEEGDIGSSLNKENINSVESSPEKPKMLTLTKSASVPFALNHRKGRKFSYPSDDDSDDSCSSVSMHKKPVFCRKRSFCDISRSPVRTKSSSCSGLTREIEALVVYGDEHRIKRSSPIPDPGKDNSDGVSLTESGSEEEAIKPKMCLAREAILASEELANHQNLSHSIIPSTKLIDRLIDRNLVSSFNSVDHGSQRMVIDSDISSIRTGSQSSSLAPDIALNMTGVSVDADSVFLSSMSDSSDIEEGKLSDRPMPVDLPPPKTNRVRRSSGQVPCTPSRIRFGTATTIPAQSYNSQTSCSSKPDLVPRTPEPMTTIKQTCFQTPNSNFKTPARTPAISAHKTPYRTPKSVRRGPVHAEEEERILGTPDYLAPEILCQKPHGPPVDWWALGVCLFEFLTGLPPFNDQTPELVFQNILNRDIPWPDEEESLSERAQSAIDRLLTLDPEHRPTAREVRRMPLFEEIDWCNLLEKEPAFVPQPDNEMDTTYFDAKNDIQDLIVSAVDL